MRGRLLIPALALLMAASPALADKDNGKKHKHRQEHSQAFCPPGLAKKDPACVPPGQAKKWSKSHDRDHDHYRVGDYIDRDFVVIRDYDRYGLDPHGTYWRVGDNLFRVDGENGRVLATLGLLSALLN